MVKTYLKVEAWWKKDDNCHLELNMEETRSKIRFDDGVVLKTRFLGEINKKPNAKTPICY